MTYLDQFAPNSFSSNSVPEGVAALSCDEGPRISTVDVIRATSIFTPHFFAHLAAYTTAFKAAISQHTFFTITGLLLLQGKVA